MIKTNLRMAFACWVVLVINIIFLVAVSFTSAKELTTSTIFLDFNDIQLIYNPDGTTVINTAGTILSMGNEWETKQFKPNIYHMRHKDWKGFYWKIDSNLKRLYKVTGGSFGFSGGTATAMEGISARLEQFGNKLSPGYIILQFSSSYLAYEPMTGTLSLAANGAILSSCKDWEAEQVWTNLYHIRKKTWNNMYWEINTAEPMVTNAVKNGRYGSLGGEKSALKANMRSVGLKSINKQLNIVTEDMGMRSVKESDYPKSEWIESEKTLYSELLKHSNFDVLVVPFQVQGYAVDRVNRSLMTRYLAHHIEQSTDLKLPDPTLVARALGERSRRFSDSDIYKLANELKIKFVIKGFVGHNLDEKLSLTLFVQERDKNGNFSPEGSTIQLDWNEIPFSDDHPPAEAFNQLLNNIVSKLPFPQTKKQQAIFYEREKSIDVPETISSVVTEKPHSPILSTYYLQLLGILYPEDNRRNYADDIAEREYPFEKSLVVLNNISPKSPDYAILKARAFFYLHSRPAALSALGVPQNPEEKAFLALLNGNLPEMEKWVDKITSPLHKLMAQIELNDLRFSYDYNLPKKETFKEIATALPAWEWLINRRLAGKDLWDQQPNILIKKILDEAFPIANFTAEGILQSRMALGKAFWEDDEEIDFSVYSHYRRTLENQWQRFCCITGSSNPVEMDYLHLLYSIGEANLWKKNRSLLLTKYLPQKAEEVLTRYEKLYQGHLKLIYLKTIALRWLSKNTPGPQRSNFEKAIDALEKNLCYWSQGQTEITSCKTEQFYNTDYPQRFWWNHGAASDRKVLKKYSIALGNNPLLNDGIKNYLTRVEISLLYTHDAFFHLEMYHRKLLELKMEKEANTLLEANQHRFIGSPQRTTYLAEVVRKKENTQQAAKLYEEAIILNPEAWEPYEKLGTIYLKEGDFSKAFNLFDQYMLLREKKGDQVELSNRARMAGQLFHRRGAIDEAAHFYKIASDTNTGSGAEMVSAGILSLLEKNYKEAAQHFLQLGKRYNHDQSYMLYMTLLHLTGYHQEAWSIYDNRKKSQDALFSAFVGYHMEGKTEEDQIKQLYEDSLNKPSPEDAAIYVLMSGIIDRQPNPTLSDKIDEIDWQFTPVDKRPRDKVKYSSQASLFAEGYYLLRKKDFSGAFNAFEKLNESDKRFFTIYTEYFSKKSGSHIPYFVQSGIKSKNLSAVEKFLQTIKQEFGENFYYHLSMAFIKGDQQNNTEAMQHLKSALNNMIFIWNYPVLPWYQLVEVCEWLYEDTGYDEYRKLTVELAKKHQQMWPMFSWSYAVEAKYTESDKDRLRSLALTLYLDRQSERISHFSEADKKKALEWLGKNNPFLKEIKGSKEAHGI